MKDPAIEEIRRTRHQISEKYGHDTRALLAHYRSLETKYADRLVKDSTTEHAAEHVPAGTDEPTSSDA